MIDKIKLKVDLVKAQVDILRMKANQYEWSCYVPEDVKTSLEATLLDINEELANIDKPEPIEYEWNLYHDMQNRSYQDVQEIDKLKTYVKALEAEMSERAATQKAVMKAIGAE